ncbi:MAG: hypothetical protein FJ225_13455 [Lentisphaerae bacterium]|nr:hypothetical protein [Lentisphaerota bacterium]
MRRTRSDDRGNAFTFLEFIAALAIVLLLCVLLLPALRALDVHKKKMATLAETREIEGAWDRYLTRYRTWPTNTDDSAFAMTGRLSRILAGEDIDGANTAKVAFVQFSKLDAATNPVSPLAASNSYYYCRFDHDYDGVIRAGGVTNTYPDSDMTRRVIVWTAVAPGDTNIVASWSE